MGAVFQEPGQYGGQMFKEVGSQEGGHLGIHHATWSVVSASQVGHGNFFQ